MNKILKQSRKETKALFDLGLITEKQYNEMMKLTSSEIKIPSQSHSKKYSYRVIWSDEDAEFIGLCAEFPSLSWMSKSQDAALKGIRKLVANIV